MKQQLPSPYLPTTTILLSPFMSLTAGDLEMHLCYIHLFVSGLFHLTRCPQGSTIEWHVTGLPSFERLNNSPLYVYLSIHLLIDYNLWTLWILLWWTWECRYLFCTRFISIPCFHFLWMVPRRGIARLCVVLFLFFWRLSTFFSIVADHFIFPP